MRANPADARRRNYLGNLFLRPAAASEAIEMWERSAKLDGHFAIVCAIAH